MNNENDNLPQSPSEQVSTSSQSTPNFTQPVTSPPILPTSNLRSKLPLLVGVIALLMLFGGIAYYLGVSTTKQTNKVKPQTSPSVTQPSPNQPTAVSNLETYTNDANGFSFQYPKDYFQYKEESEAGIYLAPSKGEGGNGSKFLPEGSVWLNVEATPINQSSVDKFINSQEEQQFYANAQKIPAKIGGIDGYKVTYDFAAVAGDVRIYNLEGLVLRNSKLYKITLSAWDKNTLNKFDTKFSDILSSFNFASQVSNNQLVDWKTQTISIQEESEMLGKKTLTMELKIPSDWTLQTYPRQAASGMIKNCSDYVITSPIVGLSLTLSPICSGWSAKYSSWPTDSVIALQQKRGGNDGSHTYYRVRYSTSTDNYAYADAMTDPNLPLDKSKDLMDAILIGYAPPKESTDDFFFIAAHLTSTYHPAASEQSKYLSIADQIAASITLR